MPRVRLPGGGGYGHVGDDFEAIAKVTYPQAPAIAARLLRTSIYGQTEADRTAASVALADLGDGNLPVTPFASLGSRLRSALSELDALQNGDFSKYVPTGVPTLDRRLGGGGLRRGGVTLLAAPTGAGKTTAVVQFAMEAAKRGKAVVVSPEMSPEELICREVVRRSGHSKWHRAPWQHEDLRRAAGIAHAQAAATIAADPPDVLIYDSLALSPDAVFEAIRMLPGPVSLVALDYAQQLASDDPTKSRYLAVGEIASRSIELARELDCAVVVTSQVNTVREKGGEKSYSIRESANLEQKAACVLYLIVDRDAEGKIEKAEFRATKVRDGALFRLEVDFDAATFHIRDKDYRPEPEWEGALRDWTQSRP